MRSKHLIRVKAHIDSVLTGTLVSLMAALVLVVTWQIFSRFVLQDPSSFTDELSRYLLIWGALLGAAYAVGQHQHIAIDLVFPSERYPIKKKLINILVLLFGLAVMGGGGMRLVWITLSLNQQSASLNIPLGYVYIVLPISGVLIAFYSLLELMRSEQ